MEENKNNKKNQEKTGAVKVIEVPSRKFIIGEKVITLTKKSDIKDITGENLGKQEIKDRFITAIKENGETEKEKNAEKDKNFKGKFLLPIIAIAIIPLMMHSCDQTKQDTQPELETIPIEIQIENIDNPYKELESLVGIAGQEELTNNVVEAEGLEGEHYSASEHFEAETQASSGVTQFEEIKTEIEENMQVLSSNESTKEQQAEAVRRLLELETEASRIYEENEEFAQKYAEKFKDASEVYRDSNTDNEKVAVDLIFESYMEDLGLSSYNVSQLEEIVKYLNEGYDLEVSSVEKQIDGDYEITGEAVREVVEDQDLNKSKSVWQKFADFVRGREDKSIEK